MSMHAPSIYPRCRTTHRSLLEAHVYDAGNERCDANVLVPAETASATRSSAFPGYEHVISADPQRASSTAPRGIMPDQSRRLR